MSERFGGLGEDVFDVKAMIEGRGKGQGLS
jgi:hypothetical protein